MLLLGQKYFVGDLELPQLPASRIAEERAFFGIATAVQATGEDNLNVYVDQKCYEYLQKMFGVKIADAVYSYAKDRKDALSRPIRASYFSEQFEYYEEHVITYPILIAEVLRDNTMFSILDANNVSAGAVISDKTSNNVREIRFSVDSAPEDFIMVRVYKSTSTKYYTKLSMTRYFSTPTVPVTPVSYYLRLEGITKMTPSEQKSFNDNGTYDYNLFLLLNALQFQRGDAWTSPLANYVYYWLMRDGILQSTATGEADLNFSRATNAYEMDKIKKDVNAMNKLINAWRSMVHYNEEVLTWFRRSYPLFHEYRPFSCEYSGMLRNINQSGIGW